MSRDEHLQWCKDRAIEYLPDTQQAFASFMSDMRKHEETENHSALILMGKMFFAGHLGSAFAMKKFIEGFN